MKRLINFLYWMEKRYSHNIPMMYSLLFSTVMLVIGAIVAHLMELTTPWAQLFLTIWMLFSGYHVRGFITRFFRWRSTWHVFNSDRS